MNEETLTVLGEAALLDGTEELLRNFTVLAEMGKMAERIPLVASSRGGEQTAEQPIAGPMTLKAKPAQELRQTEKSAPPTDKPEALPLLAGSGRYAEPYIAVPRVV